MTQTVEVEPSPEGVPGARPSYRPEPARRLWAEIVPFLSQHLGAK
jgi:hypothetical protein